MSPFINTAWPRFFIVALPIAFFAVLLNSLIDASPNGWLMQAALLLTLEAAWLADNRKPNSMEASMAKAKAGRVGNDITLRCVELAGTLGYSENELIEKWSRDSKILDIFEGTQQIQQLIVARRILGLSSAELK